MIKIIGTSDHWFIYRGRRWWHDGRRHVRNSSHLIKTRKYDLPLYRLPLQWLWRNGATRLPCIHFGPSLVQACPCVNQSWSGRYWGKGNVVQSNTWPFVDHEGTLIAWIQSAKKFKTISSSELLKRCIERLRINSWRRNVRGKSHSIRHWFP